MKRKQYFIAGIWIAYAALALLCFIDLLELETKSEVFIFWEVISNLCRGLFLVSAVWVFVVTCVRARDLPRRLQLAGISPLASFLGLIVVSLLAEQARPDVKLYVRYNGSKQGMYIEVTTHQGLLSQMFKNGEDVLVSEGRGFPKVLNISWGTNDFRTYTRAFSRDFDMKQRVPRFGGSLEFLAVIKDSDAQLSPRTESGATGNR